MIGPVMASYLIAGQEPELLGNRSPARLPSAGVFATRDGSLMVLALTQPQIKNLCRVVGRPDLLEDPRWAQRAGQIANAESMQAELAAALLNDDTDAWERRLAEAGVPAAPVNDVAQAIRNPQFDHRNVLMDLPSPPGLEGSIRVVGAGFQASQDGPGINVAPPALGEHTEEVLREIGYSAEDIAGRREAGAI